MTNHCTLGAWRTNSVIVHATAKSVTGPFVFSEIIQPAWAHNPLVTMDPETGTILVAHIGCGTIAPGHTPQNCTSNGAHESRAHGDAHTAPRAAHGEALEGRRPYTGLWDIPPCECSTGVGACQTLQVMTSTSPDGPFKDATVAWPLTNTSDWPSCLSNPSLLLGSGPDRPTLLGFNGNLAPPNNHGPTSHPGVLVSEAGLSWQGPFVFANRTRSDGGTVHYLSDHGYAEDIVLYRDARDAVHMLLHGFYDEFVGAHGWTTDPAGITGWEFSATAAYTQAVNLDGNMTTLSRRERPQVVIQNGTITHLFHGAEAPGRRHTFNMVTEVCQNGPPSWSSGVPVCTP
eukprot:m.213440 g.213440  ORF g.213440 m.213440 type:complete len:344 (+) comp26616_c0_seq1:770-1801(+)